MSTAVLPAAALRVLGGYPDELLAQVAPALLSGRMHELLRRKHPEAHTVRDDRALFEHVQAFKQRHLRNAPPLARVAYDSKIRLLQQALGTHTRATKVQGAQLKARREIRIATLFKDLPADFLDMIVVHELAHLREPEHDKAFYALCCHMRGDYHQLEFDLRLWLAADALAASPG